MPTNASSPPSLVVHHHKMFSNRDTYPTLPPVSHHSETMTTTSGRESIGQYYNTDSPSMHRHDALASVPSTSTQRERPRARQRAQLSCDRCRRLKRKCDREDPCKECKAINSTCTFTRAKQTSEALQQSRERRRLGRRARPSTVEGEQPVVFKTPSTSPKNAAIPADFAPRTSPHDSTTASSASDRAVSSVTPNSIQTAGTTPSEQHMLAVPNPTAPGSCGGMPASWEMGVELPLRPGALQVSAMDIKPDIDALLREPAFLTRMVAIWWRDVEWMHSMVANTSCDVVLLQHLDEPISEANRERFTGLLYSMTAMCALVVPIDIEAILVGMSSAASRHGFFNGEAVGAAAHARCEEWMARKARTSDLLTWNAEVFQTALVHGMYVKYTGNWNLYRELSSRDMDRMQRAGYANLVDMMEKGLDEEEMMSRYCVFWRYFTLDRISSLFDGTPYRIQARNADTWLFGGGEGSKVLHIRALCRDSGSGSMSDEQVHRPAPIPPSLMAKLATALTPYSRVMVLLGALAGRCSDRLATMSQASLAENYERAEHIAAETDDDLLSVEATLPMSKLSEQENPMVVLTIARVRRDITTRLSRHIAKQHSAAASSPGGEDAMVQTLNRRCLNTAKSLIRRGTSVCGFTPIRAIAMPFFTLFVAETMVELLSSVEECAGTSEPYGALDSESKDDLKHALIGRNFLVLLSRNSEMELNKMVTQKACAHVNAVLSRCIADRTKQCHASVLDARRILDPDLLIQAIPQPPQPLESKGSPQRAEDVLDFLGSLTSLQRIFEMSGQSWSG